VLESLETRTCTHRKISTTFIPAEDGDSKGYPVHVIFDVCLLCSRVAFARDTFSLQMTPIRCFGATFIPVYDSQTGGSSSTTMLVGWRVRQTISSRELTSASL
jgi:hypothetical protein